MLKAEVGEERKTISSAQGLFPEGGDEACSITTISEAILLSIFGLVDSSVVSSMSSIAN